jgi:hypothetical protein
MPRRHHIRLIAKQRPFDAAQWQRLLIAFAYVLHERRTAQAQAADPADQPSPDDRDPAATGDTTASGGTP